MNLAEEFVLLAYRNEGSPELDGPRLDHGLAGALLLDLALAERVAVEQGRVVVRDPAPLGDPLLDEALARIARDGKGRQPRHWVSAFARDTRTRTLDRLVDAGVLNREKERVLFVFPRTRYPAPHGVEPVAEAEARQRLIAAVSGSGPVEARTAALCALVGATGLDRKIFRDLDRKQVRRRLKEVSEGAWAAAAVKKTIQSIQAATIAAAVAASSAAAATS
ncbi:GPP34 family phosphoprotein [Actinoplanes sp. NPDC049548]|uniref:GOLPH3/VPS74 family protein n=1 Tax=Actinoplanes sp. NPDC049548 TaxID=3155152 RepID=UPI0034187901